MVVEVRIDGCRSHRCRGVVRGYAQRLLDRFRRSQVREHLHGARLEHLRRTRAEAAAICHLVLERGDPLVREPDEASESLGGTSVTELADGREKQEVSCVIPDRQLPQLLEQPLEERGVISRRGYSLPHDLGVTGRDTACPLEELVDGLGT